MNEQKKSMKENTLLTCEKKNLLLNPLFTRKKYWDTEASNYCDFFVHDHYDPIESSEKQGESVIRIYSYATVEQRGISQDVGILPKGKYTFYAYLRVCIEIFGTDNAGAYLRVTNSGNILAESKRLYKCDSEYTCLEIPFELEDDEHVQVQIMLDGAGTVYAKEAGLQPLFLP